MLAKLEALIDPYVKNSEVEMFFRVFSGKELRDFFEEKWEMPKNKKIIDMQAFNLRSLLRGSKRNKRIKLNTDKENIFSQSLLFLIRVSLIWKSSLMETIISLKKITDLVKQRVLVIKFATEKLIEPKIVK